MVIIITNVVALLAISAALSFLIIALMQRTHRDPNETADEIKRPDFNDKCGPDGTTC